MNDADAVIALRGGEGRLGAFLLGPLDINVGAGEHRLLVGPSGAGKSFLLRILAGFKPLTAGTLHAASGCAWVGQRAALFPHMRVRDNIAFGLRCQKVTAAHLEERVELLAERLQVSALLERWPAHLSAGEQQRVALARALAPQMRVLLLDEPFSALDRGARASMYRLIDSLCVEMNLGVLHVTHDIDLFLHTSHVADAMVEGKRVQTGTMRDMLRAPDNAALGKALGALSPPDASPL